MKIVGLTGGIGAGKSTISLVFKILGVPVYDSDKRAKELYTESPELQEKMKAHFGNEVYILDQINRPFLANIVFNNSSELNILNQLVHPVLQKDFEDWMALQNSRYVIKEAAILIESGGYQICDEVINVIAPIDIRVIRVMSRDSSSEKQVLSRIKSQISEEERMSFSSFVVHNDGAHSVIEQVLAIHRNLV